MKNEDVKIGATYLTKVSGKLVKVIVTAEGIRATHWQNKTVKLRKLWHVKRADTGRSLNARTAVALRPLQEKQGSQDKYRDSEPEHMRPDTNTNGQYNPDLDWGSS